MWISLLLWISIFGAVFSKYAKYQINREKTKCDGWLFHGQCYVYHNNAEKFHIARNKCRKTKGDLPLVQKSVVFEYLKSKIGKRPVWIGLNDKSAQRIYKWTDDTYEDTSKKLWSITKLLPKKFADRDRCVALSKGKPIKSPCWRKHRFICEYNMQNDDYLVQKFNEDVQRQTVVEDAEAKTVFTRVEEENEKTGAEPQLFQGDILLTEVQAMVHRTGGDVSTAGEEKLAPSVNDLKKLSEMHNKRRKKRSTLSKPAEIWPNGIVIYHFDDGFTPDEVKAVKSALAYITHRTCVSLLEWTQQPDYVNITKRASFSGCWSMIGRSGGMQELSLDAKCIRYPGVIQHEFMHVLGFWHEHMRPDRDDWVKINYDNVRPGSIDQFDKQPNSQTHGFPYETGSLMHYSWNAYAIDKTVPTIQALHQVSGPLGQREKPTEWDLAEIRNLYNCRASTLTSEGSGEGQACVFPFIYDNTIHTHCIPTGASGMTWCATTGNLNIDWEWGYCIKTGQPMVKTEGGNSAGSPCVFPFRYNNKNHFWCLTKVEDGQKAPWCATTQSYDDDRKWGTCLIPIDGGWGPWNKYSQCSKACGGGTMSRTRQCDNPEPKNGGHLCGDMGKQVEVCNEHECVPESGIVYTWEGCWRDYGFPELLRSLEGVQPVLNGYYWKRQHAIEKCAQAAKAEGARTFALRNGGKCLVQDKVKSKQPDYKVMGAADDCPSIKVGGVNSMDVFIISKDGAIDGGWSVWSDWSPCTKTCGGGLMVRLRTCSNPKPSRKGKPCDGDDKEAQECSTEHCPVDGGWGSWSEWTECVNGFQTRLRQCDDPWPSHGGAACGDGTYYHVRFCEVQEKLTASWQDLVDQLSGRPEVYHQSACPSPCKKNRKFNLAD